MGDDVRLEALLVSALLSDYVRANGPCWIDCLPSELLCHIFYFLQFPARITTTHVCHRWRAASLSAPALLWAKVESKKKGTGALAQQLARAAHTPVQLHVVVVDGNAAEVASCMASHLHHCRVLYILVDSALDEDNAHQLAKALCHRAPLLERFILMDVFAAIALAMRGTAKLFQGHAPALSCFKFYGVLQDYASAPVFARLRQLLYAPLLPLSTHELQQCFWMSPYLEVLGLEIRGWKIPENVRYGALPGTLRAFLVTSSEADPDDIGFYPPDLLSSVDHAHVPAVSVSFVVGPKHETTQDLINTCATAEIAQITVDAWQYQDFAHIELVSTQGRVREFIDVPLRFGAEAFRHLTTLAVTEGQWPNAPSWPDAPVLATLTLFLVTPIFVRDVTDFHSVLVDPHGCCRLTCPRLQTLAFSARTRGDPALLGFVPTLAPDTIRDFIWYQLSRGSVPHLAMKGVDILPNVVEKVIDLLSIVEDISSGSGHPKPARLAAQDLLHWR